MPLPAFDRVVFSKNPLFSVAAQIRFPTILRIQTEAPAQFQELVRAEFPVYSSGNPVMMNAPAGAPPEVQRAIMAAMQGGLGSGMPKAHKFVTADKNWTVQVTQDSFTFECKSYPKWEVFREKLHSAWNHFVSVYRPPYATLVGMRYQNLIERQKLGLAETPWSALLKPFIAAEFGCPEFTESEIVSAIHRVELDLGNSDQGIIQHGLATNQGTKESVYLIDNNFNTKGNVELRNVFNRFDKLNGHSGSLFRLCLTEDLYHALGPISQSHRVDG
jgi:uncharacterized protein (TIGR04255 family)